MSVFVKAVPTLRGEVADRFVKISEANLARRASVDFSREFGEYRLIKSKRKKRQLSGCL